MPQRGRDEALARLGVSRETAAALDKYVALILRWQAVKNLVSPSTLDDIWTRHILDCAQLMPLLGPVRHVTDFGSGAGLPGLVLAILGKHSGLSVDLVESNGRKAAFLGEAIRLTGAPASVIPFASTVTWPVSRITSTSSQRVRSLRSASFWR